MPLNPPNNNSGFRVVLFLDYIIQVQCKSAEFKRIQAAILYFTAFFKHARAFYTNAQPPSRRSDTIAASCGHSRTGVVAAGRHINNFFILKSIFNFHHIFTPFSIFDV